jgi:hypothetical protein
VSDFLVSLGVVSNDSECSGLPAKWITDGNGISVRIEPLTIKTS